MDQFGTKRFAAAMLCLAGVALTSCSTTTVAGDGAEGAGQTPDYRVTDGADESGRSEEEEALFEPDAPPEFTEHVEDRQVESAEADGDPPRYRRTECASTYHYQVRTDQNLRGEGVPEQFRGGGNGTELRGTYELLSSEQHDAVLRTGEIDLSFIHDGVTNPGMQPPLNNLEDVGLVAGGGDLDDADSPTILWRDTGTLSGMATFFPVLPDSAEPGSTADWRLRVHDPKQTGQADAQTYDLDTEIRLRGHWDIDERPVTVLEVPQGVYPLRLEGDGSDDDALEMEMEGQYAVYDSGVLLHGLVRQQIELTEELPDGEFIQTVTAEADVRLVATECEVPVLQRIPRDRTTEERAVAAYAEFQDAAVEEDRERILELISDEIVEAHGADAVVDALQHQVDELGRNALGLPQSPGEIERRGDRYHIQREALLMPENEESVQARARVVVSFDGDEFVIQAIRVGDPSGPEDREFFELGPDRLERNAP